MLYTGPQARLPPLQGMVAALSCSQCGVWGSPRAPGLTPEPWPWPGALAADSSATSCENSVMAGATATLRALEFSKQFILFSCS